jgi:phosphoglycolate phosphatase-like HAD superfamily hydrolase
MGTTGHTAAIVDIDGTLVDSNYQHALAWYRALREVGVTVELRRLHRHVGMGGDQLVAAAAGDEVEHLHGDAAREAEKRHYAALIDEVVALPGAHDLLVALNRRMRTVVLASSAPADDAERYVEMVGARGLVAGWTTSADVEGTKPEPDLVNVALEMAGGGPAVMIGDSIWDHLAAGRAGVPSVGVLTGGTGAGELLAAGAAAVHDTLPELTSALGDPPFRGEGRHVAP